MALPPAAGTAIDATGPLVCGSDDRREVEGGRLLHRPPRLRGDRDEVALVELVDLVAAPHRELVGALEGRAVERHAELSQPRGEAATSGELGHDDAPRLPADGLRRHDLVGPWVLEHTVLVDSGRVREGVRADDRLVRLDRDPGQLADEPARRHEPLAPYRRVGAVVVRAAAERHDRLLERGVPAAL